MACKGSQLSFQEVAGEAELAVWADGPGTVLLHQFFL